MKVMENTMNQELYQYFMQLNEAEKKSILQMLKTFVKGRDQEPERISIEQYNQEIDEALAEVAGGDYITQEEMEKQAAKW